MKSIHSLMCLIAKEDLLEKGLIITPNIFPGKIYKFEGKITQINYFIELKYKLTLRQLYKIIDQITLLFSKHYDAKNFNWLINMDILDKNNNWIIFNKKNIFLYDSLYNITKTLNNSLNKNERYCRGIRFTITNNDLDTNFKTKTDTSYYNNKDLMWKE